MVSEQRVAGDPSGPLVTITFQEIDSGRQATRHWYHVPMVGDTVVLQEPDNANVVGRVGERRWTTDGRVVVLVR